MTRIFLDTETYSETPISAGTYRYAEGCEILLISYAFDDDEPTVIDVTNGEALPDEVYFYLRSPTAEIRAHNAVFDRNVLKYNGILTSIDCWRCTRVQAYANALPGGLSLLCQVLGLPVDQAKDDTGKKLIQLFCKPLSKNRKLRRATRATHPEAWETFKDYAAQDIVAMRECAKRMSTTVYPDSRELRFYHLDQRVNDKGFALDLELIEAVMVADKAEKARLRRETADVTAGRLGSTSQRNVMLDYLAEEHGLMLGDLTKSTVTKLLDNDEIDDAVKELLRIRLQVCASSISKYAAANRMVSGDGICRGTFQHLGAKRTGRAGGKGLQPQNLPSRGLLPESVVDFGIDALKSRFAHEIYPNLSRLLVSAVRGIVVARPGHKLVIGDFANIEGRVTAWIAGEEWKLQAFRDFDAGMGPDLYNLAYSRSFQVLIASVTKDQRQIGKVQELFLGYSGGVGAFLSGAITYGFNISELTDKIYDTLSPRLVREAEDFYNWLIKKHAGTYNLIKPEFITCDVLKRAWREANPNIVALWGLLEGAARQAISHPGQVFRAGKQLAFLHDGKNLAMRLPSGRLLIYPKAHLDEDNRIKFLGDNPYTHKWGWCYTFGGRAVENAAQAISRDLLYESMERAWGKGYETVLHVHDELVTETIDSNQFTIDDLCNIMMTDSTWTKGLPLAAAGFETKRYRKG